MEARKKKGKKKEKAHPTGGKSIDVILKGGIEKQQWPDLQRANVSCIELGEVCGICQPPELWSIETAQHSSAHTQKHELTQTQYRCLKVTCRESAWLTPGWEESLQFEASTVKWVHYVCKFKQQRHHWTNGKCAAAFQ